MQNVLTFAVLGAAAGAIIALLGLGLNVIYRSSRVVNFSHAALAITAAYAYSDFLKAVPAPVALLCAIGTGMAIGGLAELLVMRPLRGASGLTRAIATIGMLLILQACLNIRYGFNPVIVSSELLPTTAVHLGPVTVGADRLLIFVVGLVLTAGLYLLYRRSTFGLATTALAVNERSLAALGGWAPRRIALLNWLIAGGLAALAGVLLAPITSLSPALSLTLVVPVLSAALVGRLTSFWLTFAGAVAIGIVQAELGNYSSVPGIQETVPFLLIVALLAVRGSSLPQRGEETDRLPRVGSGRIPVVPVVVFSLLVWILVQWVLPDQWVQGITTGLLAAIVLLSLVVVVGYAGQLSLASYALAGVAALVAAQLAANLEWSFVPAAAAGVLATAPVALLVGLPAVRTRGTNLAIVTLGLAVVAQTLVFDNPDISNGTTGLTVGDPTVFGLDVSAIFQPRRFATLVLIVFVLLGLGVLNLRRSPLGRRMIAMRGNERAAASMGIGIAKTKLQAFVVSGLIAGVGGVLIAFTNVVVVMGNPGGRFDPSYSLNAIAESTIGGVGFVSGTVLGTVTEPGAVVNQLLLFVTTGSWFNLIGGLLLLITVVTAPSGVADNFRQLTAAAKARRRPAKWRDTSFEVGPVEPQRVADTHLEVRRLGISFGGSRVLDAVDLDLRTGQVLGVIGPNGAGKTTLVDAITGYNRPDSGTIRLDGVDIAGYSPARRARASVARSFQALELFEDLSVWDNLLVASDQSRWYRTVLAPVWPGKPRLSSAAAAAVTAFGLQGRIADEPADLSYGERRLLGIARALAGRPRVLLLDEPAAGLGTEERGELRQLIRGLADEWNVGVLLIEHDVELVLGVSDEVIALDFGRVIARGTPAEVRRDPAVIAAYLGTDEAAEVPAAQLEGDRA